MNQTWPISGGDCESCNCEVLCLRRGRGLRERGARRVHWAVREAWRRGGGIQHG